MNVTFHTLASLTTATILSKILSSRDPFSFPPAKDLFILGIGFLTGILIHGILDYVPHNYPIASAVDVLLSLLLLAVTFLIAKPHLWLPVTVCFIGGIFPDLVDLATAIINKHLGANLPVLRIFPWHWKQYSGSIYDGSHQIESAIYHSIVVVTSLTSCYLLRKHWVKNSGFRRS